MNGVDLKVGDWCRADFGDYGQNVLLQITEVNPDPQHGTYSFGYKASSSIPARVGNRAYPWSLISSTVQVVARDEKDLTWEILKSKA
jgi:hypothetical protein